MMCEAVCVYVYVCVPLRQRYASLDPRPRVDFDFSDIRINARYLTDHWNMAKEVYRRQEEIRCGNKTLFYRKEEKKKKANANRIANIDA